MACFSGPNVVDDGLVLCLDAGNNKSHSSNRFISYGTGETTQNVTFDVNGTGTFQRVAAGTVISGYTVKRNDVVYSYALGGTGCHYHGDDIPISAGVSATFSFDYLVTGASNYPTVNYLANFESALSGSIGIANNLQNVWQRRTFTAGPTSQAGNLRALLYPGGCSSSFLASSGTIYYRNPKVEFTNVDTGTERFSSMSNLTTWYDLSGNGNHANISNYEDSPIFVPDLGGAFDFSGDKRFYIDISQLNNTNPYTVIWFGIDGSGDEYSGISRHTSWESGNHLIGWQTGAINTDSGRDTNTNSTGDEFMICHTNNTSTKVVSQYLNGVYYGNFSYTNWAARERWSFGSRGDGNGHQYTGKISAIQMYSRELTAAEIKQNFNAFRSRFSI